MVNNALTVTVTINPAPGTPTLSPSIPNPYNECQGVNPAATLSVSPTGTVSSIPVWYNGSTYVTTGYTYTPSTSVAGTTYYTVIDSANVPNGCTGALVNNALTVTVTINSAPTLTVSPSYTYAFCNGLSQTFTVSGATNGYVWTPSVTLTGANTANPTTVNPPIGVTVYTVTGFNGTCSNTTPTTVTLTVYSTPILDTVGSSIHPANCGKPTGSVNGVTIQANTGTPKYHYQWYDGGAIMPGDTNLTLTNVPAGNYSLQVTDGHGCIAGEAGGVTTFTILPSNGVVASFSASPTTTVSLVVPSYSTAAGAGSITGYTQLGITFTNTPVAGDNYTWVFGDGSPDSSSLNTTISHNYTVAGTYTVTLLAQSSGGCKDSAFVIIIADVPTTITIPNIFSPNGDGINDDFIIINTGMTSLNCEIFNRWGQLLSTLTAPNQGWDGKTPNGGNAPEGTYMYILQAQGLDGKTYKQNGTVTLVR